MVKQMTISEIPKLPLRNKINVRGATWSSIILPKCHRRWLLNHVVLFRVFTLLHSPRRWLCHLHPKFHSAIVSLPLR